MGHSPGTGSASVAIGLVGVDVSASLISADGPLSLPEGGVGSELHSDPNMVILILHGWPCREC